MPARSFMMCVSHCPLSAGVQTRQDILELLDETIRVQGELGE